MNILFIFVGVLLGMAVSMVLIPGREFYAYLVICILGVIDICLIKLNGEDVNWKSCTKLFAQIGFDMILSGVVGLWFASSIVFYSLHQDHAPDRQVHDLALAHVCKKKKIDSAPAG